MINRSHKESLKWWTDKIRDYEYLESLDEKEFRRQVLCCLTFIINSMAMDNEIYQDMCQRVAEHEMYCKNPDYMPRAR